MKTILGLAFFLVISFVVIIPDAPTDYPPLDVLKQRESIVFKETKIDHLIDEIEYKQKRDSLQLNGLRNEQSKTD